ncbi:HNH endonuclease [Enterococcus faecalis]|nr:HNH endonuclease [Enterococcus faecalis]MBC2818481.1 HNH endonuclease [Enterococcus faecalis]MBC2833739.1 HNH endonuclease [Enterococcus faecalis]MBC2849561.1 HNH endonuclease [Enterococcus faecalis]
MSIRNRTTQRVNKPGGLTFEERAKIRNAKLGKGKGKSYPKLYGRHEHRVVAEAKLGRPLKPGEVVHHIDHNKRNNSPENLMIFRSQSDHVFWEKYCE